jgi:hypothetical protein
MARVHRTFPLAMIDALSLLISHGVILLAAWRLLPRADLDRDPEPGAPVSPDESPTDA